MNREDLKIGQEVLIIEKYVRDPQVRTGVVTRVGRQLVDIDTIYNGKPWGRPRSYRIEEQVINDQYGHVVFRTPEQLAHEEKVEAAVTRLHEHGLETRVGRKALTDEKLLALVAFLDDEYPLKDES